MKNSRDLKKLVDTQNKLLEEYKKEVEKKDKQITSMRGIIDKQEQLFAEIRKDLIVAKDYLLKMK